MELNLETTLGLKLVEKLVVMWAKNLVDWMAAQLGKMKAVMTVKTLVDQ